MVLIAELKDGLKQLKEKYAYLDDLDEEKNLTLHQMGGMKSVSYGSDVRIAPVGNERYWKLSDRLKKISNEEMRIMASVIETERLLSVLERKMTGTITAGKWRNKLAVMEDEYKQTQPEKKCRLSGRDEFTAAIAILYSRKPYKEVCSKYGLTQSYFHKHLEKQIEEALVSARGF